MATEVDVCVVGAGFAGLTAARRLSQAGVSVAVLEARDRVGGRTWTERHSNDVLIDRGGAWLNPNHSAAFGLAAEMGVTTYKTHVAGSHLLVGGGRIQRYKGLIPRISPLALVQIYLAQVKVDRLSKQVPLDEPWTAARAAEWDADTLASWLGKTRIRSKVGYGLFDMAARGLFSAADAEDVSLLNFLFLIRAHRSIEELFSIENGAQENLVDGGLGGLALRVADDLGDAVTLSSPVRSVRHDGEAVVVGSDAGEVRAGYAIVSVPPALAVEIDFDPPLPANRRHLYSAAVAGLELKTNVVYDRPFWRDLGFSGQSAEPGSAAEVTIDASPSDGRYGVLSAFVFGPQADRVQRMPADARRRAVLEALARRFGPAAADPVEFVETAWWEDQWSRGCSVAHFPPGVLTTHGPLLRQPMGRVHWAGTETATLSHGAVDGAIRSGERAAREILHLRGATGR